MKLPATRSFAAAGCLALVALAPPPGQQEADDARMQPGPRHESNVVIGQLPPNFALESLDGETHELAAERGERPILLLFFRGAW